MLRLLREKSDFSCLIRHRTETSEELRFSQYSLSKKCIKLPGTFLDTGTIAVTRTDRTSVLSQLTF